MHVCVCVCVTALCDRPWLSFSIDFQAARAIVSVVFVVVVVPLERHSTVVCVCLSVCVRCVLVFTCESTSCACGGSDLFFLGLKLALWLRDRGKGR